MNGYPANWAQLTPIPIYTCRDHCERQVLVCQEAGVNNEVVFRILRLSINLENV